MTKQNVIDSKDRLDETKYERPRNLKHLAIHVLVNDGFLVFSNIAAKGKIDLVVGTFYNGGLRLAGVRIKTGTFKKGGGWYFSERDAKHLIENMPFFYMFCLGQKDMFKPTFIVISSTDLKDARKIRGNGNYGIKMSENQIRQGTPKRGMDWSKYVVENFKKIKDSLECEHA